MQRHHDGPSDRAAHQHGRRHPAAQRPHSPETHLLDLAETGAANAFGEQIAAAYPKLDILINNGAQWLAGSMDDYDAYAVNTTINAAATGTFLLTRKLVPSLEASGAGDIVNIVSTSGIANRPNSGAARPFTDGQARSGRHGRWLARRTQRQPVRVHAIYPPDLETVTPLDEEAWNAHEKLGGDMVTSRDVVEAALFALTRPRNVTMASIVLDSDSDHSWG
jgi:NADP-dependent 3-hydroxy acid dehydrogenase YdfG